MVFAGQFPPTFGSLRERPAGTGGVGKVFFVRSTGSDTFSGISPDRPFQTLTHALSQCTDWGNDYIILMNNTSVNEPAWPIDIEVNLVHIIGLWGAPYPNPTLMAVGDFPTIRIPDTYYWIEIAGIEFGGGATNGCIQIGDGAGNTGYVWIHHCSFGWMIGATTAQDGIRWLATHADAGTYVEDCEFGGALTRDGCRLDGNNTRGVIRNNTFRDIQGIGINVNVAGADLGAVLNNFFAVPIADAAAVGWAITFILGAGNALVMSNKASQTGDNTGNNPYRDLSVAPGALATRLNMWADNFAGQALSAGPAVA